MPASVCASRCAVQAYKTIGFVSVRTIKGRSTRSACLCASWFASRRPPETGNTTCAHVPVFVLLCAGLVHAHHRLHRECLAMLVPCHSAPVAKLADVSCACVSGSLALPRPPPPSKFNASTHTMACLRNNDPLELCNSTEYFIL